jgi:hypothetical protein
MGIAPEEASPAGGAKPAARPRRPRVTISAKPAATGAAAASKPAEERRIPAVGTKAAVFAGRARHTSGGLVASDLMRNARGKIVSKKAHAAGQKALARLVDAGYTTKPGQFCLFKRRKSPRLQSK